ncbi:MAG: GlsB/YeaQ/YmgE family stress response membrane protein [Chloroflexia bacterium]|nr:GlsB/YeaQ/YmgE family stress response membrane protein [Chloroflexia bacterium]
MGILSWIIFGAIAGWIASLIAGSRDRQGCLLNIIVGVVGAFIGGFIVEFLTDRPFEYGFNLNSFVVAVLGALAFLLVTGMARRRRR